MGAVCSVIISTVYSNGCAKSRSFLLKSFQKTGILVAYTTRAQKEREMKKRIWLSAAFIISLLPMLMNQYGGRRGVQEISGISNLCNPIGILSVFLFAAGVWLPFPREKAGKILGAVGASGIVISELYEFFTWHILTVTGKFSLEFSLRYAFPAFYIGLASSLAMVIAYFIIQKKLEE